MKLKTQKRKRFFSLFIPMTLLLIMSFLLGLTFDAISQENSNSRTSPLEEKLNLPTLLQNSPSASVIIEGRQIFTVKKSDSLSAKARADQINVQLEKAVDLIRSPKVEIKNRENYIDIYLNGDYLLTVTDKDRLSKEESIAEKAEIWRTKIEESIIQAQLEKTPEYFNQRVILAIVIFAIALSANRFLILIAHYPINTAFRKLIPPRQIPDRDQENYFSFFSKIKLGLAKISLWVVTFYLITELFPKTRELRYDVWMLLRNIFTTSLFSLADRSYSFIDLVILMVLFWGLFVATGTISNLLRTQILSPIGMNRGLQEVIFIITKYGLIAFGTIILLQVWGLNLSSLTILGSALGVGIGFGFQEIAKNFASGLVLLFERSVQVGDFIEVGNYAGTVERVGARSILLTTLDRVSIIVPNSRLLADEVINWSHDTSISRLHIPVGVAYGSDTEVVKSLLLQIAKENSQVLHRPSPQVFFLGFGDSSLDFELLVWISEPTRQAPIKSDLYFRIEKAFINSKIEIPFPQRDFHLRSEKIPFSLSPQLEEALLQWLKGKHGEQGE